MDDVRRRAEEKMRAQYARALNLADTAWRSENDAALNKDRLHYLQAQYVGVVMADTVAAARREEREACAKIADAGGCDAPMVTLRTKLAERERDGLRDDLTREIAGHEETIRANASYLETLERENAGLRAALEGLLAEWRGLRLNEVPETVAADAALGRPAKLNLPEPPADHVDRDRDDDADDRRPPKQ